MANKPIPVLFPGGSRWFNDDGTPTLAYYENQSRYRDYFTELDTVRVKALEDWRAGLAVGAGYGTYTGAFDRSGWNTGTVGLTQLAQTVAALISDLKNRKIV